MIALPIFLQMVLEYNALQAGLSLAPLSLTCSRSRCWPAGGRAAAARAASSGPASRSLSLGMLLLIPLVPRVDSGLWLAPCRSRRGAGLGLLVSQLNNYTLAPISRGAHQRGRRRQLGGRLVRAVVRPGARRRCHAGDARLQLHQPGRPEHWSSRPTSSSRSRPDLDEDAAADERRTAGRAGRGSAGDVAGRDHPHQRRGTARGLQVALLVPLVAGLLGLATAFRMTRQPDVTPATDIEGVALG